MANVAHSTLTGSQLHEPKGADTASTGTVYVSNGAGSGSWQSIGTSSFTGMIADFPAPIAPAGWLECDGSIVSTSTYAGLFGVLSFQSSGTRTNGSAVITSIPSTSNMKVGYYVFGTGINSGTTILSIDSSTQITLSAQAVSSGSSAFAVSPFLMNTGTIQLPDFTTAGRYRRSRTSTSIVGQVQADQNKAHTHTGTTGTESQTHTHSVSGTTGAMSANASHSHTSNAVVNGGTASDITPGSVIGVGGGATINATNTDHTHTFSATSGTPSQTHTHSFTTASDGGTETRPLTMIVLTCIKT